MDRSQKRGRERIRTEYMPPAHKGFPKKGPMLFTDTLQLKQQHCGIMQDPFIRHFLRKRELGHRRVTSDDFGETV